MGLTVRREVSLEKLFDDLAVDPDKKKVDIKEPSEPDKKKATDKPVDKQAK